MLAGVTADDADEDRDWLVRKIVQLRIFDDDAGVMNRSVQDVGGGVLAVSQFTLYASTRKGNRPSYTGAARPEVAQPAFDAFVAALARGWASPWPPACSARHGGRARQRRAGHDLARLARARVTRRGITSTVRAPTGIIAARRP